MSVYKRGGTWQISYFHNGKRVRKAIGPVKATAEAVLARIKLDLRAGKYTDPADRPQIPFSKACDEYLEKSKGLKGQETLTSICGILRRYFGEKNLVELTEKDVDDSIMYRRDTPTRYGRKRAGASINREVTVLRAMLNKAVRWKWIEKNPASRPERFPENRRLRYLSREEAGRLLDLAETSRSRDLYLAVLLALDEGMRMGEIFNLRWEDIDFRRDQIWVRASKNGLPRHVPLSGKVRATLTRRPRRIANDFIFWGRVKEKRDHTGMREAFVNLLQRAGIEDFTFHDLRHTYASHLAMQGVPLHTIGQLLGHKDVRMTMRYAHLSPDHLKQAAASLPVWQGDTKVAHPENLGGESV